MHRYTTSFGAGIKTTTIIIIIIIIIITIIDY